MIVQVQKLSFLLLLDAIIMFGMLSSWRLALWALLYYSCVLLIKTSMFACAWAERPSFGGLSFKTCLALAQTFGYALGKIPSLIYSPKLPHHRLKGALMVIIASSGACMGLSVLMPPVLSLGFVLLGCVSLAPTWSVLMRFLEGRRDTEMVVAIVSFSYIGCSGLSKGIAIDLISVHAFSDAKAVAVCATAGVVLGLIAAARVAAQPSPCAEDIKKRGKRQPMNNMRAECGALQRDFGVGIGLSIAAYTMLGSIRAFRDYFQLELFRAVGLSGRGASLFATSEFSISIVVLASSACFGLIEDNRRALRAILRVAAAGGVALALSTLLHQRSYLNGLSWMTAVGAAAFLACKPTGGCNAHRPSSLQRTLPITAPLACLRGWQMCLSAACSSIGFWPPLASK